MTKYSYEFKKKAVMEYINGKNGYRRICKDYNIPDKHILREWVDKYKKFGDDGLRRSREKKKYTFEFKLSVVESYLTTEVSYRELAMSVGISNPSIISNWVNDYRAVGPEALRPKRKGRKPKVSKPKKTTPITEKADVEYLKQLEEENLKLRIENAYFKRTEETAFRGRSTSERKARIIHSLRGLFKLKDILAVTGFPKSTYEYWKDRFDRENSNEWLEKEILEIRKEHKDYGYRRIWGELRNRDILVNKKKVQRIVQKLNIQVTSFTHKSRKYNSYKGKVGKVAPNRINRRFNTSISHQKITTDTSEFKYYHVDEKGRMTIKKLYLDPFMDMFNGEILSFGISSKPSAESIMNALNEAISVTNDCVYRRTFHSDQGWAYQMKAYSRTLQENKIFQSMSRKGNCHDNSVMENFFGILKQEIYYGKLYYSYEELEQAIIKYIDYYNNKRIKQKLGWLSPVEYRLNTLVA
ncbi:MAG: IS3 family transposase [Acutalibacteraceae bacterium]|nr:IS3 family transposase [Acutalibacteraceae bacterium]